MGGIVALVVGFPPETAAIAVGYAGAVGTLIDLDHFLLARLNTGDWRALGAILREPSIAVLRQDRIFAEGEVGALRRLLSHVVVTGLLVGALAPVAPSWAILTAVVLYFHVLADLAWDVRGRDAPA